MSEVAAPPPTEPEKTFPLVPKAYKGSHVGKAVLETLYKKHLIRRRKIWGETRGRMIDILQTPFMEYWGEDQPPDGHANPFPQKMKEVIVQANFFVDITSLSPPDGDFTKAIQEALAELGATKRAVQIRMLFGNIVGMGVDTDAVLQELVRDIPSGHNLKIWCGAYRCGFTSWNHSKIIAVDAKRLIEGGHNLWTDHYLKFNPVHDISLNMRGQVATFGHFYANSHWKWCITKMKFGFLNEYLPACIYEHCLFPCRVTCSHFPADAGKYPPLWNDEEAGAKLHSILPWWTKAPVDPPDEAPINEVVAANHPALVQEHRQKKHADAVPMIAVGRQGAIGYQPSDDAFVAMLAAAKKVIRISQQDFGPFCFPNTRTAIPGGKWPVPYITEIAKAMLRKVECYIVVSNPWSIPGTCTMTTANYGNGWFVEDVAAEIVKVAMQFEKGEGTVQKRAEQFLHVSMVKCRRNVDNYHPNAHLNEPRSIGNHAKFFMVDDQAFYVGSQNYYVCNLAEWGVIVDDAGAAMRMREEYWDRLWGQSAYFECDTNGIFDQRLHDHKRIDDRKPHEHTHEEREAKLHAEMRHGGHHPFNTLEDGHGGALHGGNLQASPHISELRALKGDHNGWKRGHDDSELPMKPAAPHYSQPSNAPPMYSGAPPAHSHAPRSFRVQVPAGVAPGQQLRVGAPDGRELFVQVPEGAHAGMEFEVMA